MKTTVTPAQLRERLSAFEVEYGMTTQEFLAEWCEGDPEDVYLEPWPYIEWAMLAKALALVDK